MKKVLLIVFAPFLAFSASAQLRLDLDGNVSVGNCQPLTNARLNVGASTQPIDGGVVTNAEIIMSSGSQLTIENDGILVKRTNTSLEAPLGAIVDVQHGKILKSNDF